MRVAILMALAVLGAGCTGSTQEPAPAAQTVSGPEARRHCSSASRGFRACTWFYEGSERSRIERRTAVRWAVFLDADHAPHPGHGWWRRVVASPDRRTLLGQWSGECEIQSTYLVSTADRTLRPLFGLHASEAAGWSADRRARVTLLEPIYQTSTRIRYRPGIYRVEPATLEVELERSIRPRHGC